MCYQEISKDCVLEVSDLVLAALESCSINTLAVELSVDTRTIRRWRDGLAEPRYSHYRMLCMFVENGGRDN